MAWYCNCINGSRVTLARSGMVSFTLCTSAWKFDWCSAASLSMPGIGLKKTINCNRKEHRTILMIFRNKEAALHDVNIVFVLISIVGVDQSMRLAAVAYALTVCWIQSVNSSSSVRLMIERFVETFGVFNWFRAGCTCQRLVLWTGS